MYICVLNSWCQVLIILRKKIATKVLCRSTADLNLHNTFVAIFCVRLLILNINCSIHIYIYIYIYQNVLIWNEKAYYLKKKSKRLLILNINYSIHIYTYIKCFNLKRESISFEGKERKKKHLFPFEIVSIKQKSLWLKRDKF